MAIQVTICSGPTCTGLGIGSIRAVVERLAARHPGRLEVTTQHCFSRCQQAPGLCPSVRICNEFCTNASEVTVKQRLRELLAASGDTASPTLHSPDGSRR